MSNQYIQHAIDVSIERYFTSLEQQQCGKLYAMMISETEEALIRNILARCDHNQSHTAKMLGITRNTLKKKMDQYGL